MGLEMVVWNVLLSGVVTIMGTMLKDKFDQVKELRSTLQATREDIARNHVTRVEFSAALEAIGRKIEVSFDKLEKKIDRIIEGRMDEK